MNKKEHILQAALRLFTEKGAKATSTQAIALEAQTSEALIFKHFKTKQNLLEEIIKHGYQEAVKATLHSFNETEGLDYIHKIIEIPVHLVNSNPDFWKMQYKIIALNGISQKYHIAFMKPCESKLTEAFEQLGYEVPELETELLLLYVDGLWKHYAGHRIDEAKAVGLMKLMKEKYNVSN